MRIVCCVPSSSLMLNLEVPLPVISNPSLIPSTCPLSLLRRRSSNRCALLAMHLDDPNRVGVRIESDRWGRGLKHCLTLEGQMGVDPGGWTGEASEKCLHSTTNLEGGEERREEVSLHGCSTSWFVLMLSNGNLVSFDSRAVNGERFSPEMPRSRFDDRRCQGLGSVGDIK